MMRFLSFLLSLMLGATVVEAPLSAEDLLNRDKGVVNLTSWTLAIDRTDQYYIDGQSGVYHTSYLYEQAPNMIYLIEYPEMPVMDGDYEKFYDIETKTLYSTGIGGWFAMDNVDWNSRWDTIINTPVADMVLYPLFEETSEYYIVSGTMSDVGLKAFVGSVPREEQIAHSVTQEIVLCYDHDTLQLDFIKVYVNSGDYTTWLDIQVSNMNQTSVELPFAPDSVRHAS